MGEETETSWFDGVDKIVADEWRFKAKLNIGSDAYDSNRAIKKVNALWHSISAAAAAAAVAQSGPVASAFFAPTGFAALLGIGTATTPIGWVVASAALAGAGWVGVMRYLDRSLEKRSTTIPNFINTPLDVLALALFDLMAPVALKLALADGSIDPTEREAINTYFVKEWGFDPHFVTEGLAFTEQRLPDLSLKDLAEALAELKRSNKDCNYNEMTQEFVGFLHEISEADGRIDPAEEAAIEEVQAIFDEAGQSSFSKATKKLGSGIADAAEGSQRNMRQIAKKITSLAPSSKNGKA